VTIANGGVMPVSADILGTGSTDRALVLLKQGLIPNYGLMGGGTRLKALGDIFRIRVFFLYYLSLGDIMIAVGIFLLIFFLMEPKRIMAGRLRSGKNG
ncbi:MAG TPA: DUF5317 family protein, partial [Clostridia bacterium]|nr:DUF5317 family protein [Clostridia bacterium]